MINTPRKHLVIVPFDEINRLASTVEICLHLIEKGDKVKLIYFENKYHINKYSGLLSKFGKDSNYPKRHLFNFLKRKGVKIERKKIDTDSSIRTIENFENSQLFEAKEIKQLTYEGFNIGLGVYSSLSSVTNCSQPNLEKYKHIIKRFLYETALSIECSLEISRDNKFDELHIFNGRFHHCRAVVEVFKDENIGLNYYEIVSYNGFKLLSQPEPIHNFSYRRDLVRTMWQQGPSNKSELASLFYNNDYRLNDKSSTTFHGEQIQNLIPEKIKEVRWVYYTSSDDEYESLSDVFVHPIFESQKQGVLWLINEVAKRENTELIIRVHPHKAKKCKEDADWWNSLEGKNMTLIDSYSKIDTYALAKSSDLVLCYNSTMGLESTYYGKPVIMLGDSFYRGLECGYEPSNVKELTLLLEESKLPPKPKENCLPYGYYMYARGIQFKCYKATALTEGNFDMFYHGDWKSKYHEILGSFTVRIIFQLKRLKGVIFYKRVTT